MKQRAMRRKMRKRRTGLRIIAFVVLLLCGLVSFKRIELNAELTKAKTEMVHKNKELKVEKKRTKQIEEYKVYVKTDQFTEEIAREKLGLVFPDEIIFEDEE